MTGTTQAVRCRLAACLFILAATAPREALAATGYNGYLDYLANDMVILAVLISNILLLLGFFIRLNHLQHDFISKSKALEKHEEYAREIGDHLPNITRFQLECSPAGQFAFRYISKGFEQVMGIDRERVLMSAELAFDHLEKADIPALTEAYRLGRERLEPAELEIRTLDIAGHLKWLYVSAVPYLDDGILVWDGIMQDISDSKNIEAALREEKRNFENLFETIDDFMLICDMDGHLLHTNPAVRNRLEYSEEELGSMKLSQLYPEHLRTEITQIIALMQSEQFATCGLPFQARGGSMIPVEMNAFQGSWQNHRVIFGIARDTTHRRETENALRESQQMLKLIMDTIPMSVFWKDRESVCLGCNETFLKECGFDNTEEVVGRSPEELFDKETAQILTAYDQQVVTINEPLFNIQLPYNRGNGAAGQREASKIPLHNEDGEPVGVLEIWRDVTEQNQSEERLKRTVEDMERFNELMRGRERRTLELKAEINSLMKELGRESKYETTSENLK